MRANYTGSRYSSIEESSNDNGPGSLTDSLVSNHSRGLSDDVRTEAEETTTSDNETRNVNPTEPAHLPEPPQWPHDYDCVIIKWTVGIALKVGDPVGIPVGRLWVMIVGNGPSHEKALQALSKSLRENMDSYNTLEEYEESWLRLMKKHRGKEIVNDVYMKPKQVHNMLAEFKANHNAQTKKK